MQYTWNKPYSLVWNLNMRAALGLNCLGDSLAEFFSSFFLYLQCVIAGSDLNSNLRESAPLFGTFKWQKCPRWTSHTGYLLSASCLQPALWSLQQVRPLQWSNPIICQIKPVVIFFFPHCCATCCLIGAKRTGLYNGSGSISPPAAEPPPSWRDHHLIVAGWFARLHDP